MEKANVRKMVKEYQEEIEFNERQKMLYRDRIHELCEEVAEVDKDELDEKYVQKVFERNMGMIKEFEEQNNILKAKINALEELLEERGF